MNIKVLGMGCENCDALYANTKEALAKTGIKAELEKVEDLMEIVRLGVMAAPSLMIDGKVVISGYVAPVKKLVPVLEKAAAKSAAQAAPADGDEDDDSHSAGPAGPLEPEYTALAAACKALADEKRLTILRQLSDGEKCACALLDSLNISQPTLSHHMKILQDAGLVNGRKDGKWMYYSTDKPGVQTAMLGLISLTHRDRTM